MNRQQLLGSAATWFDQGGLLSAMRHRVACPTASDNRPPPEALEAALAPLTYPDGARPDRIMEMRLVAMLKAWPGMEIEMFVEEDYLYLPLPKENTND